MFNPTDSTQNYDDAAPAMQREGFAPDPGIVPGGMAVRTFMLAVATDAGPAMLAFRVSNLLIGRVADNHLTLNHGSVSRRHCRISVTQRGVLIEDMGSQNGTSVNGVPLKAPSPLRPGDIIRVGHVPLYYFGFINPDAPPAPQYVESTIAVTPMLPAVS